MNSEYISIEEASKLTGKHHTTIYKAIRRGLLTAKDERVNSKAIKYVLKTDVIRLYGIKTQDRLKPEKVETQDSLSQIKTAIEEVLEAKQSQLMKPLEEQALYRCGVLENEVKHLQAEKDTLRQENELLREQVKALPDLQTIQEKEKDLIIQIEMERKEKEDLKSMGETIRKETEEKLKQSEEIHRKELEARQEEQNELHRQELKQVWKQAEDEGKNYLATIEELKKRLQAEEKKPWYRKLFS